VQYSSQHIQPHDENVIFVHVGTAVYELVPPTLHENPKMARKQQLFGRSERAAKATKRHTASATHTKLLTGQRVRARQEKEDVSCRGYVMSVQTSITLSPRLHRLPELPLAALQGRQRRLCHRRGRPCQCPPPPGRHRPLQLPGSPSRTSPSWP
jgi:hypothetical protein